ncbi:MAG: NADP-dependent phosphogluconate dehydrogenase [Chloroflexota bacterium]|nr:NADP-dependent phosphogluconate dehydrogenase [Chloroflexota bacterium]
MEKAKIGLVGLGVMGQNLVLNIADKGYPVAVYNRTPAKTNDFINSSAKDKAVIGTYSYKDLAEKLEKPRKIMLMVKAGPAVDAVIEEIKPYLEQGDILIDGGNSFFEDTEHRNITLNKEGLMFVGAGVSGGEEGALHGPSIMPGGQREAWEAVREILTAAAGKAHDGEACVDYLGRGSAGHYVKMVHNGIEYAIMQLIAEVYDLLHRGLGLSDDELGELFSEWNAGELSSYLVEITGEILNKVDLGTGQPILSVILDKAKQKGTGKWTSQSALDLGAATHTINAAVSSRIISGMKECRMEASQVLKGPELVFTGNRQQLIDAAKEALYAGMIISYAQGFGLMILASEEYDYHLDMQCIAKIWRAGCIIRADLLDDIMCAYDRNEKLANLLLDEDFRDCVVHRQGAMRYVISTALGLGIPVYAMSSAIAYFDSLRTAQLPANLIQAQRDYFGAHTYQRVDMKGNYHTHWQSEA